MTPNKGPITEQNDSQTIDYGNFVIGDAWTQNDQTQPQPNPNQIKTSKRIIFPIPSENQEALVSFLSALVNQSNDIICLSSYMIQKSPLTSALLAAATRGVRVYVLTASKEELARVDTDMDDVEKSIVDEYKQLLNSMAGQVLVRTAPYFHAKFLLIDPKTPNRQGVMMTCNATVDAMTGKNLEVAVTLTDSEVESFFAQFTRAFWLEAKHELLKPGELTDILQPPQIPKSITFQQIKHPATLQDNSTLKESVNQLINSAQKTLIISGWSFGNNHETLKNITAAAERGVTVKVYARVSNGNTDALAALASKGVTVKGHDRCHAKMVIADSNKAVLMTSNFTERGLDSGFETGINLGGEEIDALLAITSAWELACEWTLHHNLQLKHATKKIRKKNLVTKKIDIIEVTEKTSKTLEQHTPSSLDAQQYQPPFDRANPNTITTNRLFKQVQYTWKILPPTLPARVYQTSQKERFPIFRLPSSNETFIVVNTWEDVENAKPLAAKLRAKIVLPLRNVKK